MRGRLLLGVIRHDDEVGDVALLFFAGHEAENRVGDLLLVELGLAGLVEIAGGRAEFFMACLLYTSDAAGERSSVDLGGRRIIYKKKKKIQNIGADETQTTNSSDLLKKQRA